jgi:hypothetical protein
MAGRGRIDRILYWLSIRAPTAGTIQDVGWYIAKFTTDVANNVPAALIFPALGATVTDQTVFDKDIMEYGFRRAQGSFSASGERLNDLTVERDVRARRRISDTEALLFTLTNWGATGAIQFSLVYRLYCSW